MTLLGKNLSVFCKRNCIFLFLMPTGVTLAKRSPGQDCNQSGSFPSPLRAQAWQFCSGVAYQPQGEERVWFSKSPARHLGSEPVAEGGEKTSPLLPCSRPNPSRRVASPGEPSAPAPWQTEHCRLGREEETIFSPQKPSKMTLHPTSTPRLPLSQGSSSSSGSRCANSLIFLSRREAVCWIHQERGKQKEAGGGQEAGRNK